MKKHVIMLAGGRGTRMNASVNKVLLTLEGKTVLQRSVEAFAGFSDDMVIVCRPEERSVIQAQLTASGNTIPFLFADGGSTRQASVRNGLSALAPDPQDIILIHDAARCLVSCDVIQRVIDSVTEYGSGIPGIPVSSTYKICSRESWVIRTPDRSDLYEIQTPQGFLSETILKASEMAFRDHVEGTDDASLLEYYHLPVKVVDGSPDNIKLTTPQDISRAKSIIRGGMPVMRVGMGYDVHRLTAGRKLILCGVEIPYEMGLLGHSDADVALHALMDAMLGACALGDIGKHFPDQDPSLEGISSLILLQKTKEIIGAAGYQVFNIDITVVAQKPKLIPYIPSMISTVSACLNIPAGCINIKATTTERLGFEGRMEGISSYAVCSVVECSIH